MKNIWHTCVCFGNIYRKCIGNVHILKLSDQSKIDVFFDNQHNFTEHSIENQIKGSFIFSLENSE